MVTVNDQWLKKVGCGQSLDSLTEDDAWHIAKEFRGLQWWLHPKVLELARNESARLKDGLDEMWERPLPELPRLIGCCWVVLANNMSGVPLLRDALLLPLRWVPGEGRRPASHSLWLPDGLLAEADSALSALDKSNRSGEDQCWRLHRCFPCVKDPAHSVGPRLGPLERFSFKGFENQSWKSCWASLAAALLVAIRGGRVKPEVWASAAWVPDTLSKVDPDTLEKKLALAAAWGARRFYLHPDNIGRAQSIQAKNPNWSLEVFSLRSGSSKPDLLDEPPAERALKPLVEALEVPPSKHDPLDLRARHFLNAHENNVKANEYYYDEIIHTIAKDCRDKLVKKVGEAILTRPRLITILSKSPVSLLGAMTVQPRECLVLYTRDDPAIRENLELMKKRFKENLTELAPHANALQFESFSKSDPDFRERFSKLTRDFAGRHNDVPLIFDATSGTQRMNINLMLCAREDNWLLVITSETSPNRDRVIPGGEEPHLLRKG
jgi:hypothetical protein